MKPSQHHTLRALLAGGILFAAAGLASAIPALYVSTTGAPNSWTEVASGANGQLHFGGNIGNWNLVASTVFNPPTAGSTTVPTMGLDLNGSTATGGSFWIAFFDADAFSGLIGGLKATISGQVLSGAPETYSFSTIGNISTSQPTTSLPTGSEITSLAGVLPNYLATTGILPTVIPNSLGLVLEITATNRSCTTVAVGLRGSAVPDHGAAAALLGIALAGLALFRWRSQASAPDRR